MKKVLLVMAALTLVVSGVAAVSAYEAHLINVTAHVENALSVTRNHLDFGTVFPEEWLTEEFTVNTSTSFCARDQLRVTYVDYAVYAEWKPNTDTADLTDFYNWMGYFTYVGIDALDKTPQAAGGDLVRIGNPPAGPPGAKWVMDAPVLIHKVTPNINMDDLITIGLDVPVFEGFYNSLTDMLQADGTTYLPKPSGLMDPTYIITRADWGQLFNPEGMDFGLDIKIQVTYIGATPPPSG